MQAKYKPSFLIHPVFMLKIGYTPNIIVSLMMQIERDLLRNSSGIVSDVVVIRRPAQS